MLIFGGVAAQTFASGGAGYAIVQLLVIAAFGSLAGYVISALGHGQIGNMVKTLTVFSCIGIVIAQVMKAINAIANAFGVGL
jgi:hypothetical protein